MVNIPSICVYIKEFKKPTKIITQSYWWMNDNTAALSVYF